jgi:hypothetical protein
MNFILALFSSVHQKFNLGAIVSICFQVTEQKDDSADDIQGVVNIDERRALKGKFVLDAPLEDRICDLYDLYVEV